MLHERSNNTASFEKHLKFVEKLTFADAFWIHCRQLKEKNRNQNTVHFGIALHERSNKTASFAGHMKLKKIDFNICTFSQKWKIKIKELESGHFIF